MELDTNFRQAPDEKKLVKELPPRMVGKEKKATSKKTKLLSDVVENVMATEERMMILAELARGIKVLHQGKDGVERVYSVPPSESAIRQLNEMQHGMPYRRVGVGKDETGGKSLISVDF
jgi:uncharacterized protein with von Willebrand factor type A (vWA) domain